MHLNKTENNIITNSQERCFRRHNSGTGTSPQHKSQYKDGFTTEYSNMVASDVTLVELAPYGTNLKGSGQGMGS